MMKRLPTPVLAMICAGFLAAAGWMQVGGETSSTSTPAVVGKTETREKVELFKPLTSDEYALPEKIALVTNVVVALAGLGYALMLVGYVKRADQGTARMQEIARAVREGADAYLFKQFRVVGVLIVIITGVLWWAAKSSSPPASDEIAIGRAVAFFVGSVFSATVGFIGMRL